MDFKDPTAFLMQHEPDVWSEMYFFWEACAVEVPLVTDDTLGEDRGTGSSAHLCWGLTMVPFVSFDCSRLAIILLLLCC